MKDVVLNLITAMFLADISRNRMLFSVGCLNCKTRSVPTSWLWFLLSSHPSSKHITVSLVHEKTKQKQLVKNSHWFVLSPLLCIVVILTFQKVESETTNRMQSKTRLNCLQMFCFQMFCFQPVREKIENVQDTKIDKRGSIFVTCIPVQKYSRTESIHLSNLSVSFYAGKRKCFWRHNWSKGDATDEFTKNLGTFADTEWLAHVPLLLAVLRAADRGSSFHEQKHFNNRIKRFRK